MTQAVVVRSVIEQAIAERREVELLYGKRNGEGVRTCRPHILYESGNGKILVDVFQVAGYSADGTLPCWRPFEISYVLDIALTSQRFDLAPGYNPANSKRYVRVLARC